MANVYFTKDGINQPIVLSSNSANSSIGYGGSTTTPVTINSTAGVKFCNATGVNVGASISSTGISSNGLNVTGPITCSSLIIPTSSGSINSLGAITITTPILTCNGLTSTGSITGINTLTTPGLSCTGSITGVTSITGTTAALTATCAISGITSLTLSDYVSMNQDITNVTTLSCPTITGVNTLTTSTLNLTGTDLSCNNGISFTGASGITNNGAITGINILTTSGDVSSNSLSCNTISITNAGNVTGITSLSANGLLTLTGNSVNAGNLFVGSGFKCDFDGAITGVTTLSTANLTITTLGKIINIGSNYKLPYNSSNDISCNSLTTTTGAFSCSTPIAITTAGAISNVTSLNMSGNLTCTDFSCNLFKFSSIGDVNSAKTYLGNCNAGVISNSNNTLYTTYNTNSTINAGSITSTNIYFKNTLKINSTLIVDANGGVIPSMSMNNLATTTTTNSAIINGGNIKMIKIGDIPASTLNYGQINFTSNDISGCTNVVVCCSVSNCGNDAAIANIMIYPITISTMGANTTQFLNGFMYRKYSMNPYMSTTENPIIGGGDITTSYVYIAIGW